MQDGVEIGALCKIIVTWENNAIEIGAEINGFDRYNAARKPRPTTWRSASAEPPSSCLLFIDSIFHM